MGKLTEDMDFYGNCTFVGDLTLPQGIVDNGSMKANAAIVHTKIQHRPIVPYSQASGTDVVAETRVVHIAHENETVLNVNIFITTAPTGGDKAFTVDVKKSTAGGAFATILTGVYTVNSSKADRTTYAGTLSGTPTLVAGDALEVVVAVSGSTGSQGQGVHVNVVVSENGV